MATSKQGKKTKVLQTNVTLFGQLYISMQNRGGDLSEYFAHEIQSFPPSLSNFSGKLHLTNTKSELLQCLKQPVHSAPRSTYDCTVLDDAVIVHCLHSTRYSTFNEYAGRGHVRTRQLEGVNPRKERQGCAQESDGRDQTTRQLDGLSP